MPVNLRSRLPVVRTNSRCSSVGIIFDLEITKADEHFRIEWSASYGVTGFVTASSVRISLVPGEPG